MKQPIKYQAGFEQIDNNLSQIKQLTSYDPLLTIVKERFWAEITHHLTSLKAKKQSTPSEVIQWANHSEQSDDRNSKVIKDAYLTYGQERAVTRFLFDITTHPLSFSNILILSELLFGESGLRTTETTYTTISGEKRTTTSAKEIHQELSHLVKSYNQQLNNKKTHPIAKAAQLHHQFTVIRPFSDWNGRIARLVLNVALMNQGYLPLLIGSDDRLAYYECLEKADTGDLNPLIAFLTSKELSTIKDFMNSPEYLSIQAKYDLEHQIDRIRGHEKCFVLTEDSATDNLIEIILKSSGFNMDETNIISYQGCSKIGSANLFSIFVKEKMPHVKIIVHRDRDYLTDSEIDQQCETFKRIDTHLYVTEGTDIESCFLKPKHLVFCHPTLNENQATKLINDAIEEVYPKSVDYLRKKEFGGSRSEKYTHLNSAIEALVKNNPMRFTHGKTTLKVLESIIKEAIHKKTNLIQPSPFLLEPDLSLIANEIWRTKKF